jgi:hypothetical protein
MPRIAEFYGIVIYMYYREHGVPHFHAIYGEHDAVISVRGLRVLEGRLPRRALALVRAWGKLHQDALEHDWGLARSGRPLQRIEPLE